MSEFDQMFIDRSLERDYPPAPRQDSIKPIEQTNFEKALQATGIGLEQAGRFLDSLGQVEVPLLGKVSLADFVPFVGSAKEGSRSVLGPADWQGTPMALQQAGTGQSLTRGTGMARQLTPDASLALMDVATNAVPVGKAVAKGAKGVARMAGEELNRAMIDGAGPLARAVPQTARPLNIVQPGPSLKLPAAKKAEEVIKGIDPEEQTVLFHSGDASIDKNLKDGIEPGFGSWLDEVLSGAVDDPELVSQIRNQDPIAFYSETPDWVAMKVARVLKKPVGQVTEDDIRKHGQLSIVVVDKNDRSIWRENGKGEADQFQGQGRYTMSDIPFGVERGDIFTTDAFVPEVTLTGDDLVEFLKKNAPEKNNLKAPENLGMVGNDVSYRSSHAAPSREFGATLDDLTGGGQIYPADVYSKQGPRIYGTGMPYDKKAFDIANKAKGNPDAEVTIYRAVPSEVTSTDINRGDWVAITQEYARDHGESVLRGDYKIITKKVKAKDIYTNGDSIQEWGYDPAPKEKK